MVYFSSASCLKRECEEILYDKSKNVPSNLAQHVFLPYSSTILADAGKQRLTAIATAIPMKLSITRLKA